MPSTFIGYGEPQGYVAKAVHFTNQYLGIPSLTAEDTDFVAFSVWLNILSGCTDVLYPWLVDEWNAMSPSMQGWTSGGCKQEAFMLDKPGDYSWNDNATSDILSWDAWYHFLGCANTNLGSGLKIYTMYVNDVLVTNVHQVAQDAYRLPVNGKTFNVGSMGQSGSYRQGPWDMADFWFSTQSLLDGDGHIPEATRRKFISASGKPVNPSQFPVGGCVLFSGDKDGFIVNQLGGGAAALEMYTGGDPQFGPAPPLTDAATSPSD